jgi:hypothetical protein
MYHVLPYATLVWVGKSAFIAFIIVCVQAPADGKGGAPVVRAMRPGSGLLRVGARVMGFEAS